MLIHRRAQGKWAWIKYLENRSGEACDLCGALLKLSPMGEPYCDTPWSECAGRGEYVPPAVCKLCGK